MPFGAVFRGNCGLMAWVVDVRPSSLGEALTSG
jgi:hypothetical protein